MSEDLPDREEEFDPAEVERLREYLEERKDTQRDIKASGALSRQLWETLQQSGSVSQMVTDLGGIEEVEKVYGARWKQDLEDEIIKQSESNIEKGEQ